MDDNGPVTTTLRPGWLVSKGNVLASVNIAVERRDRRRGLIGVADVHTPLVLRPCNWVHGVGIRTALDVAYVAADGAVLETLVLKPMRVAPWNKKAVFVVEAAVGSFERWGLKTGDTVELREP